MDITSTSLIVEARSDGHHLKQYTLIVKARLDGHHIKQYTL